jgi:hypothetical protein
MFIKKLERMKKQKLFFGAAVAAALLGAVITNAHSRVIKGWQQNPGACVSVDNIPDNCNLTSGQPCGNLYFTQASTTTCMSQRFHP